MVGRSLRIKTNGKYPPPPEVTMMVLVVDRTTHSPYHIEKRGLGPVNWPGRLFIYLFIYFFKSVYRSDSIVFFLLSNSVNFTVLSFLFCFTTQRISHTFLMTSSDIFQRCHLEYRTLINCISTLR